jgi:hypothetical protein
MVAKPKVNDAFQNSLRKSKNGSSQVSTSFSLFVVFTAINVFEYNRDLVEKSFSLGGKSVSQQIGIPGIVRNGVVVPQSNHPLAEGSHVEIRL